MALNAMRRIFVVGVFLLLFSLFCQLSITNACHVVPVEEISTLEKEDYIQRLQFSISETEPQYRPFSCFDVREDGAVPVLFDADLRDGHTVCVFTSSMEFSHCIILDSPGTVHLEWNDDGNLQIFLVRASLAVSINNNGECVDVQKIVLDKQPKYLCHKITERTDAQGIRYVAKNETGFPNLSGVYSKIIAVDEDGTERALYDVTALHLRQAIVTLIIVISCVAMFLTVILKSIFKFSKTKR